MIIDQELINFIEALIIDDEREVTTMNTDHNTLISLLNTGYERIKWEKPKPKTWNFATLDKQKFITTFAAAVNSIDESLSAVDGLNTAIIQARAHCRPLRSYTGKGRNPARHLYSRICRLKLGPLNTNNRSVAKECVE